MLDKLDEQVALTVVKETDAGIVVRGSRVLATLGPLSDEIAVYPTRTHMIGPESWRQAFSFAIPNNTPGLEIHLPRELRLRTLRLRPSPRLAVRGNGLHRVLR